MTGRPPHTLASVVKLYDATKGVWVGLGPVTEEDVRTAAVLEGFTEGPWTTRHARRIVSRLELIARNRLPRYRVGVVQAVPDGVIELASLGGELYRPESGYAWAIVVDPAGGWDNLQEATAQLVRLADSEVEDHRINLQSRLRSTGATVPEAAHATGIAERTLQERRESLRKSGVDPDTLGDR